MASKNNLKLDGHLGRFGGIARALGAAANDWRPIADCGASS
jgi:hypothetical protein